jgi:hypothetical protein
VQNGQEYYAVNLFRLLVILFKLILQITKLQVFGMAGRVSVQTGDGNKQETAAAW